jgi:hypothetical protein
LSQNCGLVFIIVHDEEKSDVTISGLYLNGTDSCCLVNTTVACEMLPCTVEGTFPMDGMRFTCKSDLWN